MTKFYFTAPKQRAHIGAGIVGRMSKNLLSFDAHGSITHTDSLAEFRRNKYCPL